MLVSVEAKKNIPANILDAPGKERPIRPGLHLNSTLLDLMMGNLPKVL